MIEVATSPAPHVVRARSVRRVMGWVLVMLVPATIAHVLFWGPGLLVHMAIASAAALLAESAMLGLRGQPQLRYLTDGSALVTAVLVAFALPPHAPWWIPASASVLAIIIGKHLFGGLGRNLFNPAMVGYALVLAAVPVNMAQWPAPAAASASPAAGADSSVQHRIDLDALSSATPLDALKVGRATGLTIQEVRASPSQQPYFSPPALWLSAAIVAGGVGLMLLGIIRWHIPVSMLVAMVAAGGLLNALDPGRYPDVTFQLTTGATLLGAFFIACDPVSAATSNRGRLVFGAGIGLLIIAIRAWGQFPDGVAFAVLTMNLFVPLIDRYTVPRIYGHSHAP